MIGHILRNIQNHRLFLQSAEAERLSGTLPVPSSNEKCLLILPSSHIHGGLVQARETRHCLSQADERPVKAQEHCLPSCAARFPVQLRLAKGFQARRIGGLTLPVEGGKLLRPAGPYGLDQVLVGMVHEVEKRGFLAIFFAHEEQRDIGGQENQTGSDLQAFKSHQAGHSFSQHAIADLVMVLGKDHKLATRSVLRGIPMPVAAKG